MDDTALYRLLCDKPETGIRAVIGQYHALISAICSGILRNAPQDAEECVNECFFQLWRTVHKLQKPEQLRAYLCCTARNLAISRYRALRTAEQNRTEMPENALSDADVLLALEKRAAEEQVQNAVMTLKEPDREIFVRKYYYMESVRSLAKRFSLTEKAIESILYRSRNRLRTILKEEAQ